MSQKEVIDHYISKQLKLYQDLALDIHSNPEVSNYEFHSSEVLSNQLIAEGFEVTVDVAGHRTGFEGRYRSNKPGPVVVFLAEYDALGGIGHACGHNLFGTTAILAASSLKQLIDDVGGEVRVYGTPGEEGGENGSAKGSFVREGFLDDVDLALCAHPGFKFKPTTSGLAVAPVDIKFYGKSSHASAAPEKGINALDGIIQVYNSINALRQQLSNDVRIHGIITNGGQAPNAIPDFSSARFYLRAANKETLDQVYDKVENIVKGAALATGATYEFGLFQNAVDNTVTTPSFDKVFFKELEKTDVPAKDIDFSEPKSVGSSDVGNISQVVPTIQPTFSISDDYIAGHSVEFREAAKSDKGFASIGITAALLAKTALDVISDPELLHKIKAEHKERVEKQ